MLTQLHKFPFQPPTSLLELLDGVEVVLEHDAIGFVLEREAPQPLPMPLRPGPAPVTKTPAQPHLAHTIPGTMQVLFRIFQASAQVSYRFLLRRGRMHLGQDTCPQHLGKLAGVSAIRLDSLPRLHRHQGGRYHHALYVRFTELPL
jgi:hypothetical protein